ncbi:hypothetical protein [Fibrobacter sp. UWB11]|uniref:hypothetical protein n=1 Tax=Fibrobacter sp. UWB11 TaxID=1896202 RepID=UPI00092C07AC|nr:hypothetical protein [Fibrobacter sp. UWB11]SIN91979.1 hypothetical protein SAMN05720758_0581 [Fibrobacter sp. UWB11]
MKRFLTAIFPVAFFWACSDSNTAGATSETTNGIAFTIVDASRAPIANARVKLYSKENMSVLGTAESDTAGIARFDSFAETFDSSLTANTFVESIAGNDSSLMAWAPLDTSKTEISLLPSASLTIRTGTAETDYAKLYEAISLDATPYAAFLKNGEYTFTHVPAGLFDVVAGDSLIASVALENGASADTIIRVPGVTREFVFEDFDDGDSLNNIAKTYSNYGWYFSTIGDAQFTRPDSASGFSEALEDNENGKYLSIRYNNTDSGFVLVGTHLGSDTGYYDISKLSAIRIKVRGDGDFSVALEHYKEIGDNMFRKALWKSKASEEWREIVFRPGEEVLKSESYQVRFNEIANEIGFFTIFANSGTYLQIDDIVFEGMDSI